MAWHRTGGRQGIRGDTSIRPGRLCLDIDRVGFSTKDGRILQAAAYPRPTPATVGSPRGFWARSRSNRRGKWDGVGPACGREVPGGTAPPGRGPVPRPRTPPAPWASRVAPLREGACPGDASAAGGGLGRPVGHGGGLQYKAAERIHQPQALGVRTPGVQQGRAAHQHRQRLRPRDGDVQTVQTEEELHAVR